jgi:hypothetical protein
MLQAAQLAFRVCTSFEKLMAWIIGLGGRMLVNTHDYTIAGDA